MTRERTDPEPRLLLYRKRGIWYVRATWPDGTRTAASLGVRDRAVAEERLSTYSREVLPLLVQEYATAQAAADPDPHTDPGPRLREVLDYYLDVTLPNKGSSERTINGLRTKLYDFQSFCATRHVGRVSQVSRRLIDEYAAALHQRGLSPKTVGNYLAAVRAAFNAAEEGERIAAPPVRRIPLPRAPEPEIYPLTLDQLRRVVETIRARDPRIADAIEWIALTGNRPSDTVSLLWRHVRLGDRIVERTQVKSKRLAQYQISAAAAAVIARRPRISDFVFCEPDGSQMTVHVLYRRFTRAVRHAALGRTVNPKDLRHTFGSLMANGTPPCPLPVLQVLMGHASIQTTMRYVHAGDAYVYVDALGDALGR